MVVILITSLYLDIFLSRCEYCWKQLRLLVAGFPLRRPVSYPRSGHVGFVVDKVTLEQDFSECTKSRYSSYHPPKLRNLDIYSVVK
jgi:hypothetical protein